MVIPYINPKCIYISHTCDNLLTPISHFGHQGKIII